MKKLFILMAAAAFLAGCKDDDNSPQAGDTCLMDICGAKKSSAASTA